LGQNAFIKRKKWRRCNAKSREVVVYLLPWFAIYLDHHWCSSLLRLLHRIERVRERAMGGV